MNPIAFLATILAVIIMMGKTASVAATALVAIVTFMCVNIIWNVFTGALLR